jgi:hypothetical protein
MIHHQFSGIELVFTIYASDSATCYLSPDQKVDVGSMTDVGFNIDLTHGKVIGILMYKLKRKNMKQFNKYAIYNEDEARCIQLLTIWNVNNSKEFRVVSRLIEHDEEHTLDKYSLMRLSK